MTSETLTAATGRAVVFTLGGERYGIPLDSVQEVQQLVAISTAREEAAPVLGTIGVRGEIAPVIDLRMVVGLAGAELSAETPMLICRVRGGLVALLADTVDDVIALPHEAIQQIPSLHPLAGRIAGACRVDGATLWLIDVDALLSGIAVHEAV